MPLSDITLAGGMRSSLNTLQMISALQARTTERLSSGKRVNNPVDDPSAYFAAQNHLSRAADLAARKDAMGEAIQTVKAASEGLKAITSLIEQAKGLATSARSANTADRATLATQFATLRTQIDNIANDSGYKGTNLLASDDLVVDFNEDASSTMTVLGVDDSTVGLNIAAAAGAWATNANVDAATAQLDTALTTLRADGKTLASGLGVVSARQQFTQGMIQTLQTGADQLTLADPNEEGANLLALQTRQQLGIVAMGQSSQAQQGILRLF